MEGNANIVQSIVVYVTVPNKEAGILLHFLSKAFYFFVVLITLLIIYFCEG